MNPTPARVLPLCTQPPEGDRVGTLLTLMAHARGCRTPAEVAEFLDPAPGLRNPLPAMRDTAKAVARMIAAIRRGEAITLFSDYDCDGVTSAAQCVNLLRAAGHKNYRVYIPDRFVEDYGITAAAAARCLQEQHPALIVATDCGSTATAELGWLQQQGVEVIVLDHHPVGPAVDHPAFAHLNPKADPGLAGNPAVQDASRLSAAGLAFFFCQLVAAEMQIPWDQETNLLMAGLGTYVDVMPLAGTNRALVKHSLALANSPVIRKLPGLTALLDATGWSGRRITDYTYGFILGPCLNATGRMTHARASLQLVCSLSGGSARERALVLTASNNDRKAQQERIYREAIVQAEQLLAEAPQTQALVLANAEWHPGIVGIVAGKIRERFHRPVIVLARLESGIWKGSGRSMAAVDLGGLATRAATEGIVTGGGGHAMACGVKLTDAQLDPFRRWFPDQVAQLAPDLTPTYEVIGNADWLSGEEWTEFFTRGAPFGQGNPRPLLLVEADDLRWGPEPATKRDGAIWALKAGLGTAHHRDLTVTWTDMDQARLILAPEQKVRLFVEFSRHGATSGRHYDNWYVHHGELRAA
ncbi:MAG: DHHA1 domain-containing protein [Opitutaceae bacterium]|nr:DHHA1 domain-containing protein [Opitutaceae bacterium]